MDEVARVVEGVTRRSYGRLVSYLSVRSGDVSGAEDALADALLAALRTWPRDGIPNNPEAWLLHAARRRTIDRLRQDRTRSANADVLRDLLVEAECRATERAFPDERLKLLFVCAHPAIDPRIHTPLMLQVVLGLDAAEIAAAFVVAASTMGQRLARAKSKIQATRIAFDVPAGAELEPRLSAVLEAIYAAYAHGWEDVEGADTRRRGLTEEAIWLARVLVEHLPNEPEPLGLLALMLYCEARRPARRTPSGGYVPLSDQNPRLWSRPHFDEAEHLLGKAAESRRLGRFPLEAAIQSAHGERLRGGSTDWAAIAVLYTGLVRVAPTIGALVGRAAAVAEAHGPSEALTLLDAIARSSVENYQPYWVTRAHLLRRMHQTAEARAALDVALGLTEDPAVKRFLMGVSESLRS